MPKSTKKEFRMYLPEDRFELYAKTFYRAFYEGEKNELFLFIRDNSHLTVQQVATHFGWNKRPTGIKNMCNKTGLSLADYTPGK